MRPIAKLMVAATVAYVMVGVFHSAPSDMRPFTVVELFTSWGCSSCPPANANLLKLRKRDDVLALSFSHILGLSRLEGHIRKTGICG